MRKTPFIQLLLSLSAVVAFAAGLWAPLPPWMGGGPAESVLAVDPGEALLMVAIVAAIAATPSAIPFRFAWLVPLTVGGLLVAVTAASLPYGWPVSGQSCNPHSLGVAVIAVAGVFLIAEGLVARHFAKR